MNRSDTERSQKRGHIAAWVVLAVIAVLMLSGCGGSMDDDDAVQPHFCHANPKACV